MKLTGKQALWLACLVILIVGVIACSLLDHEENSPVSPGMEEAAHIANCYMGRGNSQENPGGPRGHFDK